MNGTERRKRTATDDTTRPAPGPPRPASERPSGRVGEVDAALRPAQMRRLCEQVRTGAYRPPLDDVAERLAAFLGVAGTRRHDRAPIA